MNRRLFWKILIAFWLTFLAITQGVWLLLELRRGDQPPPERLMAEQVAPIALAAAADAVARSGRSGFVALAGRLPENQRKRLELVTMPSLVPAVQESGDSAIVRDVVAPDRRHYQLRYWYAANDGHAGLLNTPPELLLLGLVGGLLFSAALAWYLTEPINRLRAGFDQLAQGNLGVRLSTKMRRRRDEIADLAQDFDLMANRLEQLVSARDRLLHDVSHELRSPLARVQLAIGLARQTPIRTEASLDRIDREAGRLDALVGELLTLARADHNGTCGEDYFDLAGIIESVVEDARFEAGSSGIVITLQEDIPPEEERPHIQGNAELVRRAIDNVVRNALRFSASGQRVLVAICYRPGECLYKLEVADEGPGVPEDDRDGIFDPFFRGQAEGAGFGLGLAIARRAIAAHGGTIAADNRDGGGLIVNVSIPVAG